MVHYGGCLILKIRKVRWQNGLKFYQLMIWRFSIDRGDCIKMLMHCPDAHVYMLNVSIVIKLRKRMSILVRRLVFKRISEIVIFQVACWKLR